MLYLSSLTANGAHAASQAPRMQCAHNIPLLDLGRPLIQLLRRKHFTSFNSSFQAKWALNSPRKPCPRQPCKLPCSYSQRDTLMRGQEHPLQSLATATCFGNSILDIPNQPRLLCPHLSQQFPRLHQTAPPWTPGAVSPASPSPGAHPLNVSTARPPSQSLLGQGPSRLGQLRHSRPEQNTEDSSPCVGLPCGALAHCPQPPAFQPHRKLDNPEKKGSQSFI